MTLTCETCKQTDADSHFVKYFHVFNLFLVAVRTICDKKIRFGKSFALASFHTFRSYLLDSVLSRSCFLLGSGDTKEIATGYRPPESPGAP